MHMDINEFRYCEFIDFNMCYVSYDEFCSKCDVIKKIYTEENFEYKRRFYKWYVYANLLVDVSLSDKEKCKDLIWTFLNTDSISAKVELVHMNTIIKKRKQREVISD